jgi:Fur family ferric uptake transcriptional regulator
MVMANIYIDTLKARGYRITPQRELIISILADANQHMTAEEIFHELRKHTRALNIATVYRTLELLTAEGLACRNDLGADSVSFATMQHGPHIHLVCRQCTRVIDAEYPLIAPLAAELREKYGFLADLRHISITGLCPDCQNHSVKLED